MKEYIIKIDEDKKDIMGNCPLVEKPQELVRCKNCKNFSSTNGGFFCKLHFNPKPDWFCADGERRTDDA